MNYLRRFKLNPSFINRYRSLRPRFGYNGLGEFVYRRTYARVDSVSGKKETWPDTVQRVVEGVYKMQIDHFQSKKRIHEYDFKKAHNSAEKMYDLIWKMKFLPPGRGLWAMGTDIIHKRKLYAALNNCAFVSTTNLAQNPSRPFEFTMDSLMLGVGVGFDTRASQENLIVRAPNPCERHYRIEDTRESWAESTALLISSYLKPNSPRYIFDYSKIRPAGLPLHTFGGISSGPECLLDLHLKLEQILRVYIGTPVDSKLIVDLMNLIGRCVVAGNVRRSSQIALGQPHDDEFIHLKDYERFQYRSEWGWCSNNSILADSKTHYGTIAQKIRLNGEPGIFWLDNARKYGRMVDPPNYKDRRVMGVNPCGEQSLESYELCNLVEIFLNRVENRADFLETIKYAYLYAKTVTLGIPDWEEAAEVMKRNRRIGLSLSSVAEFYEREGQDTTIDIFDRGYKTVQKWDQYYSEWFDIPRSIKTTTIKPSGSISLLAGSTPGVHYAPGGRYHLRRVRLSNTDPNLKPILAAGYDVEPVLTWDPKALKETKSRETSVVAFPIKLADHIKSQSQISIEDQFNMAQLAQKYWSDNQVSCTVTFDQKEAHKIEALLERSKRKLKSISLLPRLQGGAYQQMPYEDITEEQYYHRMSKIKDIDWHERDAEAEVEDAVVERYCSSEGCTI